MNSNCSTNNTFSESFCSLKSVNLLFTDDSFIHLHSKISPHKCSHSHEGIFMQLACEYKSLNKHRQQHIFVVYLFPTGFGLIGKGPTSVSELLFSYRWNFYQMVPPETFANSHQFVQICAESFCIFTSFTWRSKERRMDS